MLRILRVKLQQQIEVITSVTPAVEQHTLELAAAALLMEVTRADHEAHPDEEAAVLKAIRSTYTLTEDEIETLLAQANDSVDDATSFYEFTSVLNEHLNADEKLILMEDLWRVAYADGRLDKYEEYTIRKISDLLYIPHGAFIRTKHKIADGD